MDDLTLLMNTVLIPVRGAEENTFNLDRLWCCLPRGKMGRKRENERGREGGKERERGRETARERQR